MKLKPLVLVLIFLSFISASLVIAKKKITHQPAISIPKHHLRDDHQALVLVLDNMAKAKTVTYNLTYLADNIGQGIEGTYSASLGNAQKELVFGTCSKDVCVYDKNITNMILEVKTALKTGKTLVQKYQIKP